jgi:hypothetical protein
VNLALGLALICAGIILTVWWREREEIRRTPAPEVDTARLYGSRDAAVWADEFAKVDPDLDWGLMVGWFANAIETGASHVGVVEAMRRSGWTEDMIGTAMDAAGALRGGR